MDSKRQVNYLELRKKLSQYNYSQNFGVESVELVECLFNDLLNTTLSYKEAKEKENRLAFDISVLQSQIHPLRKENSRLHKENGQLHLEIIENKDKINELYNQQYVANNQFGDSINKLVLLNHNLNFQLDSKEKEFNRLKNDFDKLSTFKLKNERITMSQIIISSPISYDSKKSKNNSSKLLNQSTNLQNDTMELLKSKLDSSEISIQQLLQKIDNLNSSLSLRDDEIIRMSSDITQNRTLISSNDRTVNDISNKHIIDQLNGQIDFLNEQLAARETQINYYLDKQIDYDNLIAKHESVKKELQRHKLSYPESRLLNQNSENSVQESQLSSDFNDSSNLSMKANHNLLIQLETSKNEVEKLKSVNKSLESANVLLQSTINDHVTKISNLEKSFEKLNEKYQHMLIEKENLIMSSSHSSNSEIRINSPNERAKTVVTTVGSVENEKEQLFKVNSSFSEEMDIIEKLKYENSNLKSLLINFENENQLLIKNNQTLESNISLFQITLGEKSNYIQTLETLLDNIKIKNNELIHENSSLSNRIERKVSDNDDQVKYDFHLLTKKNSDLLDIVNKAEDENRLLLSESKFLKEEISELKNLSEQMEISMRNLYDELKLSSVTNEALLNEKERIENLLTQSKCENSSLFDENIQLLDQLKQNDLLIEKQKSEIATVLSQLNECKSIINSENEKNKILNDKINYISKDYDNLQNSNNSLNKSIIQLNDKINDNFKLIHKLTTDNELKQKEILNLKNDLSLLVNENQTLTAELSSLMKNNTNMQNDMTNLSNLINNLKFDKKVLEMEKDDLLDRYKSCFLEKKKIENDLNDLINNNNTAVNKIQDLSNELSECKLELMQLQKIEQKNRSDTLSLNNQIEVLTEELAKKSRLIDLLESDNKRFLNDSFALKQSNLMLNDRQQHLVERISDLTSNTKVLSSRISTLEMERDALSKLLTSERQRSKDMTKLVESVRGQMAKMRFDSINQFTFTAEVHSYSSSSEDIPHRSHSDVRAEEFKNVDKSIRQTDNDDYRNLNTHEYYNFGSGIKETESFTRENISSESDIISSLGISESNED